MTSPWLTTTEAAERARVCSRTIELWDSQGMLKAYRVTPKGKNRGITRFKVADLDALIEGRDEK